MIHALSTSFQASIRVSPDFALLMLFFSIFRVLTDVLILKPLSIDQSVAGANIPAVTFITPLGLHPWTCTYVRLLGPCFKTGRMKPFRQRLGRKATT